MAKSSKSNVEPLGGDMSMVVGVAAPEGGGTVTARRAGGLQDLELQVSPEKIPIRKALHNLAQAINVAFRPDFLFNELERVYKTARVRHGRVEILHKDYIGLGDGIFAKVGKTIRSIQLTMEGPDAASPLGKDIIAAGKGGTFKGVFNLLGRKLDLIQEFEDQVPDFVEQMLDRLQSTNMITGWDRSEWEISTTDIGLDILLSPVIDGHQQRQLRKKQAKQA